MRSFGPTGRQATIAALGLVAAWSLGACTDEKIIYRDRPLFEDPPEAAASFIGYSDTIEGLTVCGNCHVGVQADWEGSAHASAWAGLQSSGHASASCEKCHTVNSLGNLVEGETGGYITAPETRYHDVQCESCHGPGLTHVENPDASQPIPSIAAGVDLQNGCGECHQDTHHPFVEEWEQSKHSEITEHAQGNAACAGCHTGQGALEAWGVDPTYIEAGAIDKPITCAVCHDPHGSDNQAQLRFTINTPDVSQHLCARCHNRRTSPDPTSSHGLEPHAPETALLEGEIGWTPPGSIVDQRRIIGTHGSEANEGLCATCHVASFNVTDAETGDFVLSATGHVFNAIPCLDAQGRPTTEDCALDEGARSFQGCTTSGCHGPGVASTLLAAAADQIRDYVEELHSLLVQVDGNLTGPGGAIDPSNPEFTVAEGAYFNMAVAEFGGEDRVDPLMTYAGAAAHNPFLVRALLLSSIEAVEDEYGVTASPSLVRTVELPPGTDR